MRRLKPPPNRSPLIVAHKQGIASHGIARHTQGPDNAIIKHRQGVAASPNNLTEQGGDHQGMVPRGDRPTPNTPSNPWGTWMTDAQKAINENVIWLPFGDAGTNLTASTYLDYCGVTMTDTLGVPLLRDGSVTGVTARVNIDSYTPVAQLKIDVRIDGVQVYTSKWTVNSTGLRVWKNTQGAEIDKFTAGQQLQAYLTVTGTVQFDNPMAIIEVII